MYTIRRAFIAASVLAMVSASADATVFVNNIDYYDTVPVSCSATNVCSVTFANRPASDAQGVYVVAINCGLTTTLTLKKLEFNLLDGATPIYSRFFPASAIDNSNKVVMASFNDQQIIYLPAKTPVLKITTTASGTMSGSCTLSGFKAQNNPYGYYR